MNLAFLSLASRSVIVWLLIGFLYNPVGFVTESLSFLLHLILLLSYFCMHYDIKEENIKILK